MKLRYNNVANNLEEFRHVSVPMTCSRGNSSITVPTVAITGEMNLQGKVTAIGGLDLKILGGIEAHPQDTSHAPSL